MSRPCECRRAAEGPYAVGSCWLCWLALNTAEYGPAWGGVMPANPLPVRAPASPGAGAVGTPAPPRPVAGWPRHARWAYRRRAPGEKGVGDTLARKLGRSGERFKVWFKRITGYDCGCADRQARLNAEYPYPPEPPA